MVPRLWRTRSEIRDFTSEGLRTCRLHPNGGGGLDIMIEHGEGVIIEQNYRFDHSRGMFDRYIIRMRSDDKV